MDSPPKLLLVVVCNHSSGNLAETAGYSEQDLRGCVIITSGNLKV